VAPPKTNLVTADQRQGVWILTAAAAILIRHALQMAGLVTAFRPLPIPYEWQNVQARFDALSFRPVAGLG
jgi:hypothetical protein